MNTISSTAVESVEEPAPPSPPEVYPTIVSSSVLFAIVTALLPTSAKMNFTFHPGVTFLTSGRVISYAPLSWSIPNTFPESESSKVLAD